MFLYVNSKAGQNIGSHQSGPLTMIIQRQQLTQTVLCVWTKDMYCDVEGGQGGSLGSRALAPGPLTLSRYF